MRKLLAAFAFVALTAPLTPAFAETEHVTKTINFEPGGTLELKTFSGHVTIIGTDSNQVVVDATRHASQERLDRIKLDVYASGSTVYIDTNHRDSSSWFHNNNVVETDIEVKVPRRTNVRVNTFSASVEVDRVDGQHSVHGFSSRVRLDSVAGPVDVQTFSGNIEVRVPETARGHVSFKTFSGHLDSEAPLTLHSSSRKNLSAELGSGGDAPALRFHTFSGSVKILR
ncbi:MAG TPA: hypothetical protein VFA59_12925 [Vicinamibacterales bacterium]|nr:hypothetical protein [Vicinamibacterales bacterium]